jgi:hypothetical protein
MTEQTAVSGVGAGWKANWEETKKHFVDWWNGTGFVVGGWGGMASTKRHAEVEDPGEASSFEASRLDAAWRIKQQRYRLSRSAYPFDILPIASFDLGPGVLGLYLGSEPNFTRETVWYHPRSETLPDMPELKFNPESRWWKLTEEMLRGGVKMSEGNFYVGIPDLIENYDTLAQLRGSEPILFDLIEHPDLVSAKLAEINVAFFEAYDRIYEIARDAEGGIAWDAFALWAPGKVAKVQCDGSAMFSPDMFKQFVVPALSEQCEWLDYSMYHLDGTQCIGHLDHLLEIEHLDAIEWTPQAGLPGGGDPRWFDIYRRTRAAGKSVQVIEPACDDIPRLMNELGPEGYYYMTGFADEAAVERTAKAIEQFR